MSSERTSITDDLDALVEPGRVHRLIYTDPQIFADEMTKIFARTWVFLTHESQIANPNDFVTVLVGLRPLIVTRDDAGGMHGLLNRCAHRASTVCQEESGNAKRFTCGYHGWTYSNTGQLVGLPFPAGYPDSFDKSSRGLFELPRVESYRGFVFGSLSAEVPPIEEWLGPVPRAPRLLHRPGAGR